MGYNHNRIARRTWRHRLGTTMLEIVIATVIIGLGVTALMELLGSTTRAHRASADRSIAILHARGAWETARSLSYADLIAFAAKSADERTTVIGDGYSRVVEVQRVNITDLTATVTGSPVVTDAAVRVVVTVSRSGGVVYRQRWVVAQP